MTILFLSLCYYYTPFFLGLSFETFLHRDWIGGCGWCLGVEFELPAVLLSRLIRPDSPTFGAVFGGAGMHIL